MEQEQYVVGVDVGSGSVRAALFRTDGAFIKKAVLSINTWNPQPGFFQQSSDNIWDCCCKVIREVVDGILPDNIRGLGFDATCSLVALDINSNPISISPNGETNQNVIQWMDHRAFKEADFINKTNSSVLNYVGGKISLEMQVPKLMWLKKHLPETWENAGKFFDLPDFLTWKATGADSRSLCSVVCKWTFEVNNEGVKGWNKEFFSQIGLSDLLDNNCAKIGQVILAPGTPCGSGLSPEAAQQTGLLVGTPVATSIIDAHAGGLGMIGCRNLSVDIPNDFCSRLCLICGTSTCHMAVSDVPVMVPGVWGPYYSAMVPGLWLSEGGQSATGKLIDYIIDKHPATAKIKSQNEHIEIIDYLNKLLKKLAENAGLSNVDQLAKDLHVWPDFHGNRSPLADPTLHGMISGLTLSYNEEDLAVLYLATVQALGYGTRHILETLEAAGHRHMDCLLICGGLSKNPLFVQTQASIVGRTILLPNQFDSVLAGSAMLASYAAGLYNSVEEAVHEMAGSAAVVKPDPHSVEYHEKKYAVFLRMVEDQKAYKGIMNGN